MYNRHQKKIDFFIDRTSYMRAYRMPKSSKAAKSPKKVQQQQQQQTNRRSRGKQPYQEQVVGCQIKREGEGERGGEVDNSVKSARSLTKKIASGIFGSFEAVRSCVRGCKSS